MSAPDDDTRPVSVAELLARNERIGSPPVGGRRRRRRRNSDGVSVAELTGEIPVVRVEEQESSDVGHADAPYDEAPYEEARYEEAPEATSYEEVTYEEADSEDVTYEDVTDEDVTYEEAAYEASPYEEAIYDEVSYEQVTYGEPAEAAVVYPEAREAGDAGHAEDAESGPVGVAAPPLSSVPVARASRGPELSHDPRPLRRSSGAEQMAYDPVDESVNLADLVDAPAVDAEELRSYLRDSTDTLFSGGTVADDLARRGSAAESEVDDERYGDADVSASAIAAVQPRGLASVFWGSAVAVLQSLLAVAFGAGLFIAFDQLWRWNSLVALILSVVVVVTLAAAVRFVRKTEDIVSTLTAVAVGLLVTLGPLALQST